MFVGEANGPTLSGASESCFTRVGSGIIHRHYTRLERLARDKHSSLLWTLINDCCKKFYNLDSRRTDSCDVQKPQFLCQVDCELFTRCYDHWSKVNAPNDIWPKIKGFNAGAYVCSRLILEAYRVLVIVDGAYTKIT